MGVKGNVTIPKKRYLELLIYEEELDRLEAGGVDNWIWYAESLEPDGKLLWEEVVEKLTKQVIEMKGAD